MFDVNKVKVVECATPLYVAEPVTEEENVVVEVVLVPIIAWRIEYSDESDNTSTIVCPITIEGAANDDHAIYSKETDEWHAPMSGSGKGLETLIEYYCGNKS
jgi:hypothetical protein